MKRTAVYLTAAEARALLRALGNTTHHDDAMQAVFGSASATRKACERAEAKVQAAAYPRKIGPWCASCMCCHQEGQHVGARQPRM